MLASKAPSFVFWVCMLSTHAFPVNQTNDLAPHFELQESDLLHVLVRERHKNMFFSATSRGHMVLLIVKLVVAGLVAPDQLSKRMVLWKREIKTLLISLHSSPLGFYTKLKPRSQNSPSQ